MDLLLLHGALGSAQQMLSLQERIGGTAIDLSGHGARASEHSRMSFDAFVSDIEAAFGEQGWSQADLFGYSMGGYAALLFAARHPARVRSVVTLGTKYLWTDEGLARELRMLDSDKMLEKVPAFAQALSDVHGPEHWRGVVASVARNMEELAAAPLLSPEVCRRITCPVLCLVGDADTTAIPEDTHAFAAMLPNASVEVLPNTRHPFESTDPASLSNRVERFFKVGPTA